MVHIWRSFVTTMGRGRGGCLGGSSHNNNRVQPYDSRRASLTEEEEEEDNGGNILTTKEEAAENDAEEEEEAVEVSAMTLFQFNHFQGHAMRVVEPEHWFMWAEQLPPPPVCESYYSDSNGSSSGGTSHSSSSRRENNSERNDDGTIIVYNEFQQPPPQLLMTPGEEEAAPRSLSRRVLSSSSSAESSLGDFSHATASATELRDDDTSSPLFVEQACAPPSNVQTYLHTPKIMYFRSVRVPPTLVVYMIACFCQRGRTYFMPLTLDRDEPNLDKRVRSHIQYSAAFNPMGSGAYTHWGQFHVRYYMAWCQHQPQ